MSVEIRTIDASELVAWYGAMQKGFHSGRELPETTIEAVRPYFDVTRAWAAVDGGRMVGTLRSMAGHLAVPGEHDLPTALLTQVTVSATHRRRGLLTKMLSADLAASRDRGEPLGYLVAAEYPIYGRFGYGLATETVDLVLDARGARFVNVPDVRIVPTDKEHFRTIGPLAYEKRWRHRPGFIERSPRMWDMLSDITRPDPSEPFSVHVLAVDQNDDCLGYLVYHVTDRWTKGRPDSQLVVRELFGLTPAVEAALWRFAAEVDWVTSVRAERRALDDPLRWFLHDARALGEEARRDFTWLRVLDAAAALGGRNSTTAGRVIVDVVDKLGFANGTFVIDADPPGLACRPTTENPDLTINAADLGALYLGGTSVTTLAAVGRIDEHRAGAVATLDAVLRSTTTPWCSTAF